MDTNYTVLNNRVNTAIAAHLLNVDALKPGADVPVLSKEITEVIFSALTASGLTQEIFENLGKGTLASARAHGTQG